MSGQRPRTTNAVEFVVIRKPSNVEDGLLTWVESMDIFVGQIVHKKEFRPDWSGRFLVYDGYYFKHEWLEPCSDRSSARMALDFKDIDTKYDSIISKLKADFEERKKNYEARKPKKSFWDRLLGK